MKKVNVAVVGLGFGAEFVPIYQSFSKSNCVAVCRRDKNKLNEFADKFKLGITLPQIVLANLGQNQKADSSRPFNFIGFLGAKWRVPEYRLIVEPSVCIRKIGDVPFGTDLNVLANLLDDKLYLGFTYSFGPSDNRTGFLAGVRVNQFRFIYSYDQTYQTFQTFNRGSHELTLSFDLNGKNKTMSETKEEPVKGEMTK